MTGWGGKMKKAQLKPTAGATEENPNIPQTPADIFVICVHTTHPRKFLNMQVCRHFTIIRTCSCFTLECVFSSATDGLTFKYKSFFNTINIKKLRKKSQRERREK